MKPSAPGPATGLTSQLRAATRRAHDHVDGTFPNGLDSHAAYVRYLTAILPLAQWLHDSWRPAWPGLAGWHEAARVRHLEADLSHLGASPVRASSPNTAASAAEWLGGSYVLEGSAMGARLLARDLDRLQSSQPLIAGARSFIDSLVGDPRRWARFRHVLDSLPDHHAAAAMRGALRGFGIVEHQLDAMEAAA